VVESLAGGGPPPEGGAGPVAPPPDQPPGPGSDPAAGPGPDGTGQQAAVVQPITATGEDGEAVDFTGGGADSSGEPPPAGIRNLAYVVGDLGDLGGFSKTVDQGATGDFKIPVTGFEATIITGPGPQSASPGQDIGLPVTFSIGTAAAADVTAAGANDTLAWGRWTNGIALISLAGDVESPALPGGSRDLPLTSQSLHWITELGLRDATVLPVTGTATYDLAGGTKPTDTLGNVGLLEAASLTADFSTQSVGVALRLTIDAIDWFATGTVSLQEKAQFRGTIFEGSIGGTAPLSGFLTGFLVPGSSVPEVTDPVAAALAYTLFDDRQVRGPVSGVAGFVPSLSAPITVGPPAPERRDVAFAVGNLGQQQGFTSVNANAPGEYALNADFGLTRFAGGFPSGSVPTPAEYDRGTSGVTDDGYDGVTLLRWGRWSGGQATVAIAGSAPVPVALLGSSLHWVVSANAGDPPVLPASGEAVYILAGNTAPTDTAGNTCILNGAFLIADFTNQIVDSTITLSVGTRTFSASGTGTLGAEFGLPAHQFRGFYDVSGVRTDTGQPFDATGSFDGFFTTPGAPPASGVPGGAGLAYSLLDVGDGVGVQGSAAFSVLDETSPPGS